MATNAPSCPPSAAAEAGLLTEAPLDAESLLRGLAGLEDGAALTFLGIVRGRENGRPISAIVYEAYRGMAEKELSKILSEARSRWPVKAAVRHRTGRVAVGQASLAVAVLGAHRREAFEALHYIVEQIKARAAIWKIRFEQAGEPA